MATLTFFNVFVQVEQSRTSILSSNDTKGYSFILYPEYQAIYVLLNTMGNKVD